MTLEWENVDADADADVDEDVDVDEGVDGTSDAVEARDAERGAMTPNAPAPTGPVFIILIHFHTTPRNATIPTATTPFGLTKATNRSLQQNGKNVKDKASDHLHGHTDTSQ